MPKGLTFLPALALAGVLALPLGAQETPTAETVVATVNGQEITLGHMIIAHATLPEQYRQLPANVLFDGILEQLIQQSALAQSFSGDLPSRVTLSLENEERSLLAAEVVEDIMRDAASDDEIAAAYAETYANGDMGEEYNASHILVETEEAARQIKADLDAGADFAETAREKSTGPSGPGGGALGWFGTGMMVPDFEAAVIALSPGEVSAPVQTQFGWHVILLNETRVKAAPALEDVREEIANGIRQQAATNFINAAAESADVQRPDLSGLAPEILRSMSLLEN
ncbi:MAG: peptidylprolyl isomerase [Rhodobacteraceae bacterium]|nr:peptidylprolyl isomerase [Paracoccaceae bacterium]